MSWPDPAYERLVELLATTTGLVFPPSREASVEAAVRGLAKRANVDVTTYIAGVIDGSQPLDALVDELTVGETYFFRDPTQFDVIRTEILPRLRAERSGMPLRMWSAGCASGEEAYTLGMVADEIDPGVDHQVLATDISPLALAKARAGRYTAWSMRGCDERFVAERSFPRSFPRSSWRE